jgi:hypothetical protein
MTSRTVTIAAAALLVGAAPAAANEFAPRLTALAEGKIAEIAGDPRLVEAVRNQNAETAGIAEAEILRLDETWRGEVGAATSPTIDAVMDRPSSAYLREMRDAGGGLFTEIFVTDSVGLNVAASDVTSDYWQGDEAKFTESFGAGPGAVHLGEIEFDESTQMYQSQVSVPVLDPESGAPIGAATFGVNVELLD